MSLEAGAELPTLRATPDRLLTVRYAGASGDYDPVHVDEAFATAVGLPGRVLHGLFSMGLVARAQTQAAGGPGSLKRLAVVFGPPGVPEREITVTSTVVGLRDGRAVVHAVAEQDGTAIIAHAEAELAPEDETRP